jgi:hypothetical protein
MGRPDLRVSSLTAVLLALAAGVGLAGCGDSQAAPSSSGSSPSSTPSSSSPSASPSAPADLELTVSSTAERGALLVTYSVVNKGATQVVVNDRIPVDPESASGRAEVDPQKAFVYAEDGVVVVAKRTFAQRSAPAGPDHSVYFQGTLLAPGATISGQALVRLPFAQSVPSFAKDVPGEVAQGDSTWRFCLGVTPSVHDPDVLPDKTHALVSNNLAGGPRAQQLVCSGEQGLTG